MTAEAQRPERGICPGPDLQQRGGQARGDARLRRRPGDTGPRLPRRGAGPLRRAARRPGEAGDPRPRRHADDRPVHLPRPGRATSIRRSPSGSPRTCSFRSSLPPTTAACVLLPPGEMTMTYGRGPEYTLLRQGDRRPRDRARRRVERPPGALDRPGGLRLLRRRPPHPRRRLCATTPSPTEGVMPEDMFLQVKGEGLNVGCVLTWGPCYDYQRQFFEPTPRRAERAVHGPEVRRRGQRLRLAGARACLPAEPARPDLPGFRRDGNARAGRRGRRRCCAGPRRRGRSPATPTRPRAWRSTPRRPPSGCSPRSTRTRTARSTAAEAGGRSASRATSPPIDADRDGVADPRGARSQPRAGRRTGCRTWRSRR